MDQGECKSILLTDELNADGEYFDELDNIFDYDIYEANDKILLKVYFDYIKQHSIIAFPTPTFLHNLSENK